MYSSLYMIITIQIICLGFDLSLVFFLLLTSYMRSTEIINNGNSSTVNNKLDDKRHEAHSNFYYSLYLYNIFFTIIICQSMWFRKKKVHLLFYKDIVFDIMRSSINEN